VERERRLIIIISCGAKKVAGEHKARDLYVGAYFRAQLAYALSRVPAEQVFVLSAKYGLVRLGDELEAYDLRMGEPGSVEPMYVGLQAEEVFKIGGDRVVALGGAGYVHFCRRVFGDDIETPLEGRGGLGQQIAWLRHEARRYRNGKLAA